VVATTFPLGRDRVKAALSSNEVQCFEAAGLFTQTPTPEILQWWDELAQEVRAVDESKRLEQGRVAENAHDGLRNPEVITSGITNRPRWIALDDNTAGYDVHSYEKGRVEPVAKLIEVKSSSRKPARFFLTRNDGILQSNEHLITVFISGYSPNRNL